MQEEEDRKEEEGQLVNGKWRRRHFVQPVESKVEEQTVETTGHVGNETSLLRQSYIRVMGDPGSNCIENEICFELLMIQAVKVSS
jgi:hypothetical protein